jgi:hypothetical protein
MKSSLLADLLSAHHRYASIDIRVKSGFAGVLYR